MHNHHDPVAERKRNFNIAHALMVIHQRALVVPLRKQWGANAIGVPCAWALALMVFWAGLAGDGLMWCWVLIWVVSQARCRRESVRLAGEGVRIHSYYDGFPSETIKIGKTEKACKLIVEPMLIGVLGGVAYWVYDQCGMPVHGLPWFLLFGLVSLPFVELVKQQSWENRVQGTIDARIEAEALMNDVRDRMGDY